MSSLDDYQRRKHGKHDTECQCLGKALDASGTQEDSEPMQRSAW